MSVTPVAIMSNKQRNSIEEGLEQPFLSLVEKPSTAPFVIDSKDRITGNQSEFVVDMGYQLSKVRYLELKRVIVPKIPNITSYNNTIRMRSEFGGGTLTASFTLPVGFYNTNSLSNTLTNSINSAFVTAGIVDTVTASFDVQSRTFSLSSVNGIDLCFDETCSFIRFGKSLAPFESQSLLVPASKTTIYSASAGMLFTRYISISSNALTQFSVGNGITSSVFQPPSIIGIVDLIDLYEASDWDITGVYNGIFRSVTLSNPARLFIANSSRLVPRQIDISVKDMYGNDINDIIQLGGVYPTDDSPITLLFEAFF